MAFPVVVLIIGLTPDQGRDFSVCIQSVGMNAAAFLLLTVKRHLLDFKLIVVFTLLGTLSVLTGLACCIQPYYINLLYTSFVLQFSVVYFYTNVLAPRKTPDFRVASGGVMPSSRTVAVVHTVMIIFAFAGGIVTANVGSGSDIMLYAFGIYVWNFAFADTPLVMPENKLTASSVVVMGLLSLVTAVARQATVGISMNVWYAFGACSWLVCWGAPLGSLLLTPALQMSLRASFYIMSCIQFLAFGIIKIEANAPHVLGKRLSSMETWVSVTCLSGVVLALCAVHHKVQTRRLHAAGNLAATSKSVYINRLIPIETVSHWWLGSYHSYQASIRV